MVDTTLEMWRLPKVVEKTGLSAAEIKKMVQDNEFPLPRRIAKQLVAWLSADVLRWIEGCFASAEIVEAAEDAFDLPQPKGGPTQLYRHFDQEGRLLYVGISLGVLSRLAGHKQASEWFQQIGNVTTEHFPTRSSAMLAERRAIKSERPIFNIRHNGAVNAGG